MAENGSRMGRPLKLDDPRKIYSIRIGDELMTEVDAFVFAEKLKYSDYSRADFFNEAAAHYLATNKR